MEKTIITYDTHHGSAQKVAERLAEKLNCNFTNVDTPFEAENVANFDNIILVFGFRGPYTAQLTKLFLSRKKDEFKGKNVFLVGEGLFSEKEFPVVAEDIHQMLPCQTFTTFFIKGELRVNTLTKEEKAILGEFSRITGMEIKDMGELNLAEVDPIAAKIQEVAAQNPVSAADLAEEVFEWVCPLCGYVHKGPNPPAACPLCGAKGETFNRE